MITSGTIGPHIITNYISTFRKKIEIEIRHRIFCFLIIANSVFTFVTRQLIDRFETCRTLIFYMDKFQITICPYYQTDIDLISALQRYFIQRLIHFFFSRHLFHKKLLIDRKTFDRLISYLCKIGKILSV